jgi:hypothetical protein
MKTTELGSHNGQDYRWHQPRGLDDPARITDVCQRIAIQQYHITALTKLNRSSILVKSRSMVLAGHPTTLLGMILSPIACQLLGDERRACS